MNLAEVGDPLKRGEVLVKLGGGGRSTGQPVHFGVLKDGRVLNPQRFVAFASVTE